MVRNVFSAQTRGRFARHRLHNLAWHAKYPTREPLLNALPADAQLSFFGPCLPVDVGVAPAGYGGGDAVGEEGGVRRDVGDYGVD